MNEQFRAEGDINTGDLRDHWNRRHSAETNALLGRDSRVFIHQSLSTPCLDVVRSANGSTITTHGGQELLDFHGNSVHQGGYANSFVLNRISETLKTIPFCPRRFTNIHAIECAEYLTGKTGGKLSRVLFAPSGSIANSTVLKLARIKTGRHKVISFWESFHGAGMDTIAVGGERQFKEQLGPLMEGVFHIHWPDTKPLNLTEQQVVDSIEEIIVHEGDIGAIIAEPFRCTEIRIPSPPFWQAVRALCDKYDIALIFDEIPTSLWRAGTFFAYEQFGIVPDIITLGKGLGGGVVPFAAVIAHESFNCAESVSLGHYTHEKSPLGSAAALGLFDWFASFDIQNRVEQINVKFTDLLNQINSDHIKEIRSISTFFGVELDSPTAAEQVLYQSLEQGLSFKVSGGNVLTLAPPLSVTDEELIRAGKILKEILERYNDTTTQRHNDATTDKNFDASLNRCNAQLEQ